MVRIARPSDPEKIRYLKQQIHDRRYMASAIQRLAHKLTEELVHSRSDAFGQQP